MVVSPMAGSPTRSQLESIAAQFSPSGNIASVEPLGNGNINSTYLVSLSNALETAPSADNTQPVQRFVLQRINAQVFRQPELVIKNMAVVSEHLDSQTSGKNANHQPQRWEMPRILPTKQGKNFWRDDAGEYWRAISFIENSQVIETVETASHAREVGYGLAIFHRLISSLPAERLADTLEGFHITPSYLSQYQQVLEAPAVTSLKDSRVHYCMEFVQQRQDWAHVLEDAKAAGDLRLRPIHGDPKVNNIMLGPDGKAVSLIDLDTLKPGLVHYDIGDCLRSGCNRLGEETEDWQQVTFDIELASAMLSGYLSVAKDFLTEQDYDYMYDAIRLIAFELGLRFLTDYLAGNVYFKVKHPTHNLTRALVQFKLTESIEAQEQTLKSIIQELR